MLQLARADILRLDVLFLRSSSAIRAENLVFRRQLARYIERDPALRRNRARLHAELEHMRAHGSGITIDEITPGVWACAAPIVEHGKVVAALSVAGPAFRIGKAKRSAFEALVRNAAREVSAGIEHSHGVT